MSLIDIRMVFLSYSAGSAVCTALIALLWLNSRKRFAGPVFWLAGFLLQWMAVILVALRSRVPDGLSVVGGNASLIVGVILLIIGLQRFLGKRGSLIYHAVLLIIFTLAHAYFAFISPSLAARNIDVSLALLVLCGQAAWLALGGADRDWRSSTRGVGILFAAVAVISLIRIIVNLVTPPENDFFRPDHFDTLLLLAYPTASIALTFGLWLMVNQRLLGMLEHDSNKRRQAEEELRKSEERFRSLIEASSDWIWEVDRKGVYTYSSPKVTDLLGYSPEEVIGKTPFDLFAPGEADRLGPEMKHLIEQGMPLSAIENTNLHKDGHSVTLETSGIPILDKDGNLAGYRGIDRDITERQRAEELIRLRLRLWEYAATHPVDELMQKALDEIEVLTGSLIGFYHFVEDDQLTLSLQAWSTRTEQEFCKAEGKGMHYRIDQAGVWVDCVHQRKPVIHNDYSVLPHRKGMPDGHAEVVRELVVPILRGQRVVSILGVGNKPRNYDEKDIKLVAYVADIVWRIVERRRAAEALTKREEDFRKVFEVNPVPITITRLADSRVVRANRAALEYFEVDADDLPATRTPSFYANPPDRQRILDEVQTRGEVSNMPVEIRSKTGRAKWAIVNIFPIDFEGQPCVLSGFADITERKLAEEALRKSNAELQARSEELDAFGHTVAHDLKNPLSNIIGFAYLMEDRENPPAEDEMVQMIQTVKQLGLKMDSIIEELMLLAGLREAEVEMKPLNMETLITEVLWRLAYLIDQTQSEVIYPASWPQAVGYAPWVEEVWINYINNAIKYGGQPPHVELGVTAEGEQLRFWVQDNGHGLSSEEQARLFTPFERLDQAHISGHGLGLSIVRRIVERMGGQVSVKSSEAAGEGSTFSFTLPAA